jgi:hypothetical protein
MENKYFTPDKEDIYIGYECEILYPHNMIEYNEKLNENLWEKHKFELRESLSEGDSMSFDYIYRTLYLTKEQIEAEGWSLDRRLYKIKKNEDLFFTIDFNTESYFLEVSSFDKSNTTFYSGESVFKGTCKDINTFRKLIKLLGI